MPHHRHHYQWHFITAYLFEPVASRAVRQAHQARVSGDRRAFASDDTVEDGDRAIPPGTEVIIRPRFPRVSSCGWLKREEAWSLNFPWVSSVLLRTCFHETCPLRAATATETENPTSTTTSSPSLPKWSSTGSRAQRGVTVLTHSK